MAGLEDLITENVRDALNGDKEACKRLNALITIPFSSIQKLFHSTPESKMALNVIAGLKATGKNPDPAAVRYCERNMPEILPRKSMV